ncbi:MAG: peptide-methionine (S)-S-oxide reductase MsrA [Abditibacteriaceae bacterium]
MMKKILVTISALIAAVVLISCAQSQASSIRIPLASTAKPSANEKVATFSEGCFWHSEIVFQSLVGVRDAVSGYAGGHTENPTYEEVSTGNTGHAETVNVYYDPSKISYKTLVDAFFASQDPTELNRQGPDMGTQYRSIAFYRTPEEKKIIEEKIKQINASKKYSSKIVTQVVPFTKFYKAEAYHQEYISHHPDNPYVQSVSIPDYEEFRRNFKEGKFK